MEVHFIFLKQYKDMFWAVPEDQSLGTGHGFLGLCELLSFSEYQQYEMTLTLSSGPLHHFLSPVRPGELPKQLHLW